MTLFTIDRIYLPKGEVAKFLPCKRRQLLYVRTPDEYMATIFSVTSSFPVIIKLQPATCNRNDVDTYAVDISGDITLTCVGRKKFWCAIRWKYAWRGRGDKIKDV